MINIEDFDPVHCSLAANWHIFKALYDVTSGDPCRTGCAWYQGGKCPEFQRLTNIKTKPKTPTWTNAEIAKELNCSTRAVAKKRKAGTLPEKYTL